MHNILILVVVFLVFGTLSLIPAGTIEKICTAYRMLSVIFAGMAGYILLVNRDLRLSRHRLAVIHQLAATLSEELEPHELLKDILAATKSVVTWDFGAILMDDGEALVTAVVEDLTDGIDEDLDPDSSIIREIVRHGKSRILEGNGFRGIPRALRSVVVCPMVTKHNAVGCILLGSKRVKRFKKSLLWMLDILAAQAAATICNANAFCKARQQAVTDGLTNLYNYRYIYSRLKQEISDAAVKRTPVSLILFDIDFFKHINDEYGHIAGDRILIETAKILMRNVREIDTVGRYGGEEFAVILPETGAQQAFKIAERIRSAVEAYEFYIPEFNKPVNITVSAGIATFPDNAATPVELVNKADKAMMRGAKREGRNKVEVYTRRIRE